MGSCRAPHGRLPASAGRSLTTHAHTPLTPHPTLPLLPARYVDEVIIGAPWVISRELITSMNIQAVVRGTTCDLTDADGHARLGLHYDVQTALDAREEAYSVPARLGILKTMPSPETLTALHIVSRILKQRDMFQARYTRKAASEETYIQNKQYVQEQ